MRTHTQHAGGHGMNLFYLAAILSGLLGATQGVIMGRATKVGGLQVAVAALSIAQAVVPLLIVGFQGKAQYPSDWRLPLIGGAVAGLMGTAILTLNGLSVVKIGAGSMFVFVTCGTLLAGMISDHLGLSGVIKNALEPMRLAGAALVIVGAWLISR